MDPWDPSRMCKKKQTTGFLWLHFQMKIVKKNSFISVRWWWWLSPTESSSSEFSSSFSFRQILVCHFSFMKKKWAKSSLFVWFDCLCESFFSIEFLWNPEYWQFIFNYIFIIVCSVCFEFQNHSLSLCRQRYTLIADAKYWCTGNFQFDSKQKIHQNWWISLTLSPSSFPLYQWYFSLFFLFWLFQDQTHTLGWVSLSLWRWCDDKQSWKKQKQKQQPSWTDWIIIKKN